jgi:prevent-host-death family protein
MNSIGSYEAKTHLPSLLDRVAAGERITITKHGIAVAVLVPVEAAKGRSPKEVIEELKRLRKGRRLGGATLRELIAEGRRF